MSMTNAQILKVGRPVICTACGVGTYRAISAYAVACRHCNHGPHLNMDIRRTLGDGETLTITITGTLYVVPRAALDAALDAD